MSTTVSFDALLDAVETLPIDQQSDLVEVIQRRIAERAHLHIVNDAAEARDEHGLGKTRIVSVDELKLELGL